MKTIIQSVRMKTTLKGSSGKLYFARMQFSHPNIPEELLDEIESLPVWKRNKVMRIEESQIPLPKPAVEPPVTAFVPEPEKEVKHNKAIQTIVTEPEKEVEHTVDRHKLASVASKRKHK